MFFPADHHRQVFVVTRFPFHITLQEAAAGQCADLCDPQGNINCGGGQIKSG
jgi:hypothetical protein